MNEAAVSVIVPVYNAEKWLMRCADSILGQSFDNLELILIDDGAQDASGQICDALADRDHRVRVMHQENMGVSAARNRGLDMAQGRYITFVDSDDALEPTFVADAFREIEESGAELYISGLVMEHCAAGISGKTTVYGIRSKTVCTPKALFEMLEVDYPQICICSPCGKLYSAALLRGCGIRFQPDLYYGEDTYFNLEVLERAKTILFSDRVYYHYYRDNADSLFSRFHADTYEIHVRVYDKMRELLEDNRCSPAARKRFENMYFAMLVGGIHAFYRFSAQNTLQARKQQIRKVAQNPHVKKLRVREIQNRRQKQIRLFMRMRLYFVIEWIFRAFYGKRNGQQAKKL